MFECQEIGVLLSERNVAQNLVMHKLKCKDNLFSGMGSAWLPGYGCVCGGKPEGPV